MIINSDNYNRLENFFDVARPLNVTLLIDGPDAYDFCCFGVDADEKLSDDRYMIFYNQLSSPADEIVGAEISSGMEFIVNLNALPQTIHKLVFTCSIDGAGTMTEISRHKISVGEKISVEFSGKDFKRKKSIVSLEIFCDDGWRFNIAARNFDGELDALLNFYGGEQIDDGEKIFYKVDSARNTLGEKFSAAVDSVTSTVSVAAVGDAVKDVTKCVGKGAVKGSLKAGVAVVLAGTALSPLAAAVVSGAVLGAANGVVDKIFDDD